MSKGKLFLVATPIGNQQDITLRAKKVLSQVDIILAEDTRKTLNLLNNLAITFSGRLISYYEENEMARIPQVVDFLNKGLSVALVSNAGSPLLSDPGFKLVRIVVKKNFEVIPIPGPSALISALTISALPAEHFVFLGFLPKRAGKKKKILSDLEKVSIKIIPTICFYESPNRIKGTLEIILDVFGDVPVCLCWEMTKMFQRFDRGNVSRVLSKLDKDSKLKGELTVVLTRKHG